MKLNKKQVEALNNLVESVQELHEDFEINGDDGCYPDSTDMVLVEAEKLVYALGKTKKEHFSD